MEKARKSQENICFIDYFEAFDCIDHNKKKKEKKKLWKIIKETGIPDYFNCLLRNLYMGQEMMVRLDMEEWTYAKSGKEYYKAMFSHPVYLTYMQSAS